MSIWSKLRRLLGLGERKPERFFDFSVANLAKIEESNPEICVQVESALPAIGVFPVYLDSEEEIIIVNPIDNNTTVEDVMQIFKRFGLNATLERIREE